MSDIIFSEGDPGERVAEAVEEHIKSRPRGLWLPKRAQVEKFFANMAEEVKRAGGTPHG